MDEADQGDDKAMIDGAFFLIACVAIGLLVNWMMQNDRVRPGGRTIGLFAMLSGDDAVSGKTKTSPGKAGTRPSSRTRPRTRED